MAFVGFVLSLFLKTYSLDRKIIRTEAVPNNGKVVVAGEEVVEFKQVDSEEEKVGESAGLDKTK